jgi:hypothetical protein
LPVPGRRWAELLLLLLLVEAATPPPLLRCNGANELTRDML